MNKGKSIFLLLCLAIFCIFTGCKSNDEIENDDEHEIKHEHTLVFNEESKSNCTHEGTKEFYQCDECKKMFSDSEGLNEITREEIIIPISDHKDENNDLICDYDCGKVIVDIETVINDTLVLKDVLVKSYNIPLAINTLTYIEEGLIYVNVDEGKEEKYIFIEDDNKYSLIKKESGWEKEELKEEVKYDLSYVFNEFDLEINGEIELNDCYFGTFSGRKTFKYKNKLGNGVSLIINNETLFIEGVLIYDENNNIIYELVFTFGKNEEILESFSNANNSVQ